MKKSVLLLSALLIAAFVSGQSLEDIVKNYTVANKLDKITSHTTIKISATMSMMGMDLPMEMWMKNPNKIKTVTNFNGQEMIQVFDGEKGYVVNPMQGSTTPVEMTAEEASQLQRSNMFKNYLADYLKEGKLALDGEEAVNGSPAFKVKATVEGGTVINMFIDKTSYMLVKTSTTVDNQGMAMVVEQIPSDYKETNGVILPMKTTISASGMEFAMTFTKVEVDIPMEDSVFKVN